MTTEAAPTSTPSALEPFAPASSEAVTRLPTARQTRFLGWLLDVLISIVVINLFVEYAPSVIVESFTISVLTALLLKLMMDAIVAIKGRVFGWFKARGGTWQILGYGALWLILFLSKFVVLEVTYVVFRDRVSLGGFIEVTVLILTLILTREVLALIYFRVLGAPQAIAATG